MSNKNSLEMTPIMALSIMTIFAMMLPLFTIASRNRAQKVYQSRAMEEQALPSPTPL